MISFHPGCLDAVRELRPSSGALAGNANHGSIGDSWPIALLGSPRGHTVARETAGLTRERYSPSNPRAQRPNRLSRSRKFPLVRTLPAHAAGDFNFSASNLSPFFQTLSVMAAILRARVSRAIAGAMPLANRPW